MWCRWLMLSFAAPSSHILFFSRVGIITLMHPVHRSKAVASSVPRFAAMPCISHHRLSRVGLSFLPGLFWWFWLL